MSDLPPNIARPHRAAHRNYKQQTNAGKDAMTGQNIVIPKKSTRIKPSKPIQTAAEGRKGIAKPIQPAADKRKGIEKPGQGLKQTDIVAFNQDAEVAFISLITGILKEDGKLSYREAIQEAAYELNISTETAKRYLVKHSARRAEFSIEDGSVTLKQARR